MNVAQQLENARALLALTESNLSRLIAAKHSDEVLMTPWRDEIRAFLAVPQGPTLSGIQDTSDTEASAGSACRKTGTDEVVA